MYRLTEKQMIDVVEAVNAAHDFLDGYVDVVYGDYGEPAPNKAMQLQQYLGEVQDMLDRAMNEMDFGSGFKPPSASRNREAD